MALSLDLRCRIVDLVGSGVSCREAARRFQVSRQFGYSIFQAECRGGACWCQKAQASQEPTRSLWRKHHELDRRAA